jgi:hypothetical protein
LLAARGPSGATGGFAPTARAATRPVRIILLLFAFTILGCGYHYQNPQNPYADYGRDRYECERENRRYESHIDYVVGLWPQPVSIPVTDWVTIGECMRARGWRPAASRILPKSSTMDGDAVRAPVA